MPKSRIALVATACVIAVAAAIMIAAPSWRSADGRSQAVVIPAGLFHEDDRGIQSGQSRVSKATRPNSPAVGLWQAFPNQGDVRPFVLKAMQRPTDGGLFYARFAMNLCTSVDEDLRRRIVGEAIAGHGTVSEAQLRALEADRAACASFAPGERQALYDTVAAASAHGQDPLLRAESDLNAAMHQGDREALRRAVQRALDLQDSPLLSQHRMLFRIVSSSPQAKAEWGMWLEGKLIAGDNLRQLSIANAALDLGACLPEQPCALDRQMRLACGWSGICAADRENFQRAYLLSLGMPVADVDEAIQLARRIQQAVAARNVLFFTEP